MNSFTDIGQYRNVVRAVCSHHDFKGKDENGDPIYKHDSPYPTLTFRGTVKLHGTNAAVVKYKDGHYEYQSRERVLSPTSDNANFMKTISNCGVEKLFDGIEFNESCAIFGEWCGGSIQKSVALNKLPLMWVIFAIKIDNVYHDLAKYSHLKMEDKRIFNILQFPYYFIDIDFNIPEIAQEKMVKLVAEIEECCPVGKYFFLKNIENENEIIVEKNNDNLSISKNIEKFDMFKDDILSSIKQNTKNLKNGDKIKLNINIIF